MQRYAKDSCRNGSVTVNQPATHLGIYRSHIMQLPPATAQGRTIIYRMALDLLSRVSWERAESLKQRIYQTV